MAFLARLASSMRTIVSVMRFSYTRGGANA